MLWGRYSVRPSAKVDGVHFVITQFFDVIWVVASDVVVLGRSIIAASHSSCSVWGVVLSLHQKNWDLRKQMDHEICHLTLCIQGRPTSSGWRQETLCAYFPFDCSTCSTDGHHTWSKIMIRPESGSAFVGVLWVYGTHRLTLVWECVSIWFKCVYDFAKNSSRVAALIWMSRMYTAIHPVERVYQTLCQSTCWIIRNYLWHTMSLCLIRIGQVYVGQVCLLPDYTCWARFHWCSVLWLLSDVCQHRRCWPSCRILV